MWISIFELPDGDIESVELFWDKQVCYESTFASEYGLDKEGYVKNDDMGLGRHRIIEIKDDKINLALVTILGSYIMETDKKYSGSLICGNFIEEWLDILINNKF